MNTNKWLYFRTSQDTANDDGKDGHANKSTSALLPTSRLISMHPASATVLSINFAPVKHLEESNGYKGPYRPSLDRVNLTITANTHESVMESITEAITAPNGDSFINVADDCTILQDDSTKSAEYINSNIDSVEGLHIYKTPQGNGMHEYFEIVKLSTTDAHTDASGDAAGSLRVYLPAQCILLEAAITSHALAADATASVRLDYHSAAVADGVNADGTGDGVSARKEWVGADAASNTSIPDADLNIGSGDVLYDTVHSGSAAAVDRDTAETHFQVVAAEDFTNDAAATAGIVGVYIKWFGPAAQSIL